MYFQFWLRRNNRGQIYPLVKKKKKKERKKKGKVYILCVI